MKILIGALAHETNSFCAETISFDAWMKNGYREGEEIREKYENHPHAIGGMLQALEEEKETPEIVFGADMTRPDLSGGIVDQKVWDLFLEKMMEKLHVCGPVDGILLSFHGAMQTTGFDDPEGEAVRRLRQAAGTSTVLSVSTDLHAYISDLLVENADFVCGYHTYPHVDQQETGYRAAKLLLERLKGKHWKILKIRIPMIVPPSVYSTLEGPFRELMEEGKSYVKDGKIRDFSIYQMQPWLDIKTGGSSVVVIGDRETEMRSVAEKLAGRLLELRQVMRPDQRSIEEVLQIAEKNQGKKPVVLVDCADSQNAGASGDSAEVAIQILERHPGLRSAIAVNDADAVAKAFETDVGKKAFFRLGGTIDAGLRPLEAEGYVRSLHDGVFLAEGPAYRGMEFHLGKTAVIRFGRLDVLACERIVAPGDPQLYRAFGIEPTLYDLVDVKACTSFRAAYTKFTDQIFETDTPGAAAVNLKRLPYQKLSREEFWPWNTLKDYKIHETIWGWESRKEAED